MRPELRAVATSRGGVISRQDAVRCGYRERELKTRTGHGGDWVVVRRGWYAEREVWDRLDVDGRYLLQARAAAHAMRADAVLSHTSAAAVLGMPLRPRWRELVHVTRPGVRGSRTEGGVKHHLAAFDERDLLPRGEETGPVLAVTGLARTAVDVARELGFEDGLVACDAALRLGAARSDMVEALDRMRSWPHVTRARAAARLADAGAQTIGETVLRIIVLELDIGVPETQFVVREGDRWAAVDLRVGRHLFEFDGRVKYVERERGGVADRPLGQVVWDEKRREDWLRAADGGYGMSRVVWEELWGRARVALKRRLLAEYAETVRRFGDPGRYAA